MASNETSRSARVLDPLDRVSEILFGLLMALSITGAVDVATADERVFVGLFVTALGCNLAWGGVDAVFYVVGQIVDRGQRVKALRALSAAPDAEAARRLLASNVPDSVVELFDVSDLQRLRTLAAQRAASTCVALQWTDLRGAIGVFLLVTTATFPVVAPYLLIDDAQLARRVSNAVSFVSVYLCGHVLAVQAGARPVRFGFALVGICGVLVAAIEFLGG
jgi:hypothetical protein